MNCIQAIFSKFVPYIWSASKEFEVAPVYNFTENDRRKKSLKLYRTNH